MLSHNLTPHNLKLGPRPISLFLSMLLTLPLFVGCARQEATAPVDNAPTTRTANTPPGTLTTAKKPGLTNVQKGAIVLVGAAALYYLYNQHKHAQEQTGQNSQYYLSKNGRVYYRDAQHKPHWVTPPSGGIPVPASEAQKYQEFQGYDNRATGRNLSTLPEARSATY